MKLSKSVMTIVRPDGTIIKQKPTEGEKFSLKELQTAVSETGVWSHDLIEIAPTELNGFVILVNEEGLLKNMEPNTFALQYISDLYVGPVVFVPESLIE